jgi:hypothetical protein
MGDGRFHGREMKKTGGWGGKGREGEVGKKHAREHHADDDAAAVLFHSFFPENRIFSARSQTGHFRPRVHTHTHTYTHTHTEAILFLVSFILTVPPPMSPNEKNNRVIYFSGFYYRPETLKSLTCLVGNTEKRVVYDSFELLNLNSNAHDYTHDVYQKYLETNYFIVPGEQPFWAHMMNNVLPTQPSKETDKGLFNVFPLCLNSDDLFKTSGSNMGEWWVGRREGGKEGGRRGGKEEKCPPCLMLMCVRAQVWCRLHLSKSNSNSNPS